MSFEATTAHTIERSQALYDRAKKLIPGGTQLLSKRPEMFAPDHWPAYYRSAKGCQVIDLDGNSYVDMSYMGIGACMLGYADPDVSAAVVHRVENGAMCTLNPSEEVALAEQLVALHPWSEQVRFSRAGGEAMSIAVRVARAATGREVVAFCGYHGWHDWYLAANCSDNASIDCLSGHLLPGLSARGIPRRLAGTALPFVYNDLDQLRSIVKEHGNRLAAVVMEPTRSTAPAPSFLEGVRDLCDQSGAAWILDEITTGFRFALGGSHLCYHVEPDIAVFAKALGNGHPIAAVIGRAAFMEAAQESFISSTFWTESVGPAAALATLAKMRQIDVPSHVARIGNLFVEGLRTIGKQHGLSIKVSGHPALISFAFDHSDNLALQTLYTTRMLAHGFLAGAGFYPSLAHTDEHVDRFLVAADEVFAEVALAARLGDARDRVGGSVRHTGFARLA